MHRSADRFTECDNSPTYRTPCPPPPSPPRRGPPRSAAAMAATTRLPACLSLLLLLLLLLLMPATCLPISFSPSVLCPLAFMALSLLQSGAPAGCHTGRCGVIPRRRHGGALLRCR